MYGQWKDIQQPPVRLDLWLKGPVYHGARVALTTLATTHRPDTDFSLSIVGADRPSIVGRLVPLSA